MVRTISVKIRHNRLFKTCVQKRYAPISLGCTMCATRFAVWFFMLFFSDPCRGNYHETYDIWNGHTRLTLLYIMDFVLSITCPHWALKCFWSRRIRFVRNIVDCLWQLIDKKKSRLSEWTVFVGTECQNKRVQSTIADVDRYIVSYTYEGSITANRLLWKSEMVVK